MREPRADEAVVDVPPIRTKEREALDPTANKGEGDVGNGQSQGHDRSDEGSEDGALFRINQRERSNDKTDEVGARITHIDFGRREIMK